MTWFRHLFGGEKLPHYRRVIVSDAHVGHPLAKVEALCGFLNSCTFDELYLAGDMFDDGLKKHFPAVYRGEDVAAVRRVLAEIQENAAAEGRPLQLVRISGNHDPFPDLDDPLFAVANQPVQLDATTLLTHGHHEEILWRAGDIMNGLRRGLKRPPVARPGLSSVPWRMRAAAATGVYRRLAAHRVRLPELQTVIHGHLHLPCVQKVRGVALVCLPDWIDHDGGAVVEFADGRRALVDAAHQLVAELAAVASPAGPVGADDEVAVPA